MKKGPFQNIYQFKIVLLGIKPPIWRRIQVFEDCSFEELREAIQDAMGWEGYHLHEFRMKKPSSKKKFAIGVPSDKPSSLLSEKEISSEQNEYIKDWFTLKNKKAEYSYDFGDSWEHTVTLEKILPREKDVFSYPACIDGKRACPPEDCGGIWGYERILKIMKNRKHREYKETIEWLGGRFNPEEF